jgi:hypothetical protein
MTLCSNLSSFPLCTLWQTPSETAANIGRM